MKIRRIELNKFRNFEKQVIEPSEGINVFTGRNAQGKSNFLESICFAASSRSFRTSKDRELIKWDSDFTLVKMFFESNKREQSVEISLDKSGKKKIKINEAPIKSVSELMGKLLICSFVPEDISLIKGQPKERRRFMNREISQIYPVHLNELIEYNKVLMQRNRTIKLFKLGKCDRDMIRLWDPQLAKLGDRIVKRRIEFIRDMNDAINIVHSHLTKKNEELMLHYSGINQSKNNEKYDKIGEGLLAELDECFENDIRYGYSTRGPHKDDFDVKINGEHVKIYGSQGQKRTASLSIKMAQIEMLSLKKEEGPIVLLDDVSSELDEYRRLSLLDYLLKSQSFITTTDLNDYKTIIKAISEYKVHGGTIERVLI